MEKGYIAPAAAWKKLRTAKGLGQTVYLYGATGYGKTELVRQYLSRRRYRYISCAEDAAGLTEAAQSAGEEKEGESRSVVVADDLHLLKNAQGRKAVLSLAGRSDIWLILICRSPIPAWLMPLYIKGGFLVITEDDLRLGEKEISAYMGAQGLTLMGEELAFVAERSRGNTLGWRMPRTSCGGWRTWRTPERNWKRIRKRSPYHRKCSERFEPAPCLGRAFFYLFLHGFNTPLLAAFRRKKPGLDTPLLAAGWFIYRKFTLCQL